MRKGQFGHIYPVNKTQRKQSALDAFILKNKKSQSSQNTNRNSDSASFMITLNQMKHLLLVYKLRTVFFFFTTIV